MKNTQIRIMAMEECCAHNMEGEGTKTRRDIHTEGHTHGGGTHGGDTHGGRYTWRDIHMEGHTHEEDTHIHTEWIRTEGIHSGRHKNGGTYTCRGYTHTRKDIHSEGIYTEGLTHEGDTREGDIYEGDGFT